MVNNYLMPSGIDRPALTEEQNMITSHTRLRFWFSRHPSVFGYAPGVEMTLQQAVFFTGRPDAVGTPRQIAKTIEWLNKNTSAMYGFRIADKNGKDISIDEVRDFIARADYLKKQ